MLTKHILWLLRTCICVTPAQLMRPGVGRNASCALKLGDCLNLGLRARSRPRELWFSIYSRSNNHELPSVAPMLCVRKYIETISILGSPEDCILLPLKIWNIVERGIFLQFQFQFLMESIPSSYGILLAEKQCHWQGHLFEQPLLSVGG